MPEVDSSPPGTVLIEGEMAFLTFQRRLHHPPEDVWEAITSPAQLAEWYFTEALIDGRPGGSIDFHSGPNRVHVTGRILAWDPPRRFEHEWKIEPGRGFGQGAPHGEDAVVRWELSRDGKDTVLTVTHRNVTRRTALGVGPAGHVLLDRLAAHLGGRPLPGYERLSEIRHFYPSPTPADLRPWDEPEQ